MLLLEKTKLNFELKTENLEDLWVLSQFIVPEDKIFATTERKVKIGNDNTKQVKKLIHVDLLVKKVNFDSDNLRVSGEIQNETEFTAIGQNHSLNFAPGDKIKLEKDKQKIKNDRKMGHITVINKDLKLARKIAEQVKETIEVISK